MCKSVDSGKKHFIAFVPAGKKPTGASHKTVDFGLYLMHEIGFVTLICLIFKRELDVTARVV